MTNPQNLIGVPIIPVLKYQSVPQQLNMGSGTTMFMNLKMTIKGTPDEMLEQPTRLSTTLAQLMSKVPPPSSISVNYPVPQTLYTSSVITGGEISPGASASAYYQYQEPSTTTDLKVRPQRTNYFVPCRRCPWSDHVTIDCKRKICPECRAMNVDSKHIEKCARETRVTQQAILDTLRRLEKYAERLTRLNTDDELKEEKFDRNSPRY